MGKGETETKKEGNQIWKTTVGRWEGELEGKRETRSLEGVLERTEGKLTERGKVNKRMTVEKSMPRQSDGRGGEKEQGRKKKKANHGGQRASS